MSRISEILTSNLDEEHSFDILLHSIIDRRVGVCTNDSQLANDAPDMSFMATGLLLRS